ncbi:MAG: signal peptidase II [Lachnospiraceae bacterium]|nr:signal peptidase II [Lachnospiraceae bacterium]
MNSKAKRLIFDVFLFAVLIFLDRITKYLAVSHLKDTDGFFLIDNVLELYYLPNGNTGAAFGMLEGHRILFLVISFVVVGAIFYLVYNMPDNNKYKAVEILLIFIAAGGVGNMIDRLLNGYVVDFIYISCINFPIFNVADMYVSICTTILAIIVLFVLKEADYEVLEKSFTAPFKKNRDKKDSQ